MTERSRSDTAAEPSRRQSGASRGPIGRVVAGRYRIDALVGVGGMGRVYRARQLGLERDVALKIVRREGAIAAGDERFRDEAEILARLRHPNIVTLYDFIQADADSGMDYLAMELVDGECLDTLLGQRGRLPWRQVCSIAAQISSALQHAHARGIVHRDLKPANVAVIEESADEISVRVLDFGVAKLVGRASACKRTKAGFVVGTPAYMAPEQEHGDVAPAVDLYALGVLAFEAGTGRLPRAESLAFQGVDVDKPLELLLRRLLSVRPEDRPTAAEAAQQFASLAAEPPRGRWRGASWSRARLAIAAVALVAAGATVGAAADHPKVAASPRSPRVAEVGLSPAAQGIRTSESGKSAAAKRPMSGAKAAPAPSAPTPEPRRPAPRTDSPNAIVFSTASSASVP